VRWNRGGRHSKRYPRRAFRFAPEAEVPLPGVVAVLLADSGWCRVLNHSFSVSKRLKLTFRSQSTGDLGPGFYFYGDDGPMKGRLTTILAWREDPLAVCADDEELDLLSYLPAPAKPVRQPW